MFRGGRSLGETGRPKESRCLFNLLQPAHLRDE